MRPDVVVVVSPGIDGLPGIGQILEPVFVQAIVSERTVETLDKRVLHGFAGLNEVQLRSTALAPEEHRLTGKFGAVVADNRIRFTASLD